MSHLLRRLIANLWQVVIVSLLSFYLFSIVPGDFYSVERFNPQLSPRYVDQLQRDSGLTTPWPQRYWHWSKSCLSGDCGTSIAYGVSVTGLLAPRLSMTLAVALPGMLIAWLIGIALALARFRATLAPLAATAAMAPDLISIALLLWLAVRFGISVIGIWLPIAGMVIALTPVVFLHAASSLETVRQLPFVQLARQRGITGVKLWLRYIAPAAAGPLVSLAGLSFTAALGASLLIEVLTGWPGLGPLFLESIQTRDYPIVQTTIVLMAILLAASNLAADLVLYRLDPRIRVKS